MTVHARHRLHQINAIVCITLYHLQILHELLTIECFPSSTQQSSHILNAAEDVLACLFADKVHDRHYLVTAEDSVAHIEKFSVFSYLFLSLLIRLNQLSHLFLDSVLLVEVTHQADTFVERRRNLSESHKLVELYGSVCHLRWSEDSIDPTTLFAIFYEQFVHFFELVTIRKHFQKRKLEFFGENNYLLFRIMTILLMVYYFEQGKDEFQKEINLHSQQFGDIFIAGYFSLYVGIPQLHNHPCEPLPIRCLFLQNFQKVTRRVMFFIDAGDSEVQLTYVELIERTHERQEVFPAKHMLVSIGRQCFFANERNQILPIQADPYHDLLTGAARPFPFKKTCQRVQHSNNYKIIYHRT